LFWSFSTPSIVENHGFDEAFRLSFSFWPHSIARPRVGSEGLATLFSLFSLVLAGSRTGKDRESRHWFFFFSRGFQSRYSFFFSSSRAICRGVVFPPLRKVLPVVRLFVSPHFFRNLTTSGFGNSPISMLPFPFLILFFFLVLDESESMCCFAFSARFSSPGFTPHPYDDSIVRLLP